MSAATTDLVTLGAMPGSATRATALVSWILCGRLDPSAPMQNVTVAGDVFRVGRHPENDCCIANPAVSGRHAELVFIGDDLFVRDLQSTNGTFVNGMRITGLAPIQDHDILQFGTSAFTVYRQKVPTSQATVSATVSAVAVADLNFHLLLTEPAVEPHFQPIVDLATSRFVGYEVLARSEIAGLETPASMFRAAAEHNLAPQLSEVIRSEAMKAVRSFALPGMIFVNTHPAEVGRPELLQSLVELRNEYPSTPVVIEIHEAAVTSLDVLRTLRSDLNSLNMGLAYDDFGSGQSRLRELVDVPPDYLKFDIGLIHGLADASVERRNMLETLVKIARELKIVPLAEGVETADEAAICLQVGFELAQGYYFGRPAAIEHWSTDQGGG